MAVEWIDIGPFVINAARIDFIGDRRTRQHPAPLVDVYFKRRAGTDDLETAFQSRNEESVETDPDLRLDGDEALRFLDSMQALQTKAGGPRIVRMADQASE